MGQIRRGFKGQVLFLVLIVVVVLVGLSAGISFLFLDDVYIFQKKAALKGMYGRLTSVKGDTVPDEIYRESERKNLNWLVISSEQGGDRTMKGYFRDPEQLWDEAENVSYRQKEFSGDGYVIEMNRSSSRDDCLQLTGMQDGRYVIIQCPLESIRESVTLANWFYVTIGGVVCLLSLIFINQVLKVKTQPIMELVSVSKHAASLDFDQIYSGHCGNELDLLGENLNQMMWSLKSTLEQLRESNVRLQEYLAFQTREEERRRRLVTDISHELKTPLALIQGYTEGLTELVKEDPQSCDMYCEIISDEVQKTDRILKRLFRLNQLEHEEVRNDIFDVISLIRKVIEEQRQDARIQGTEIIFVQETPVYVQSDPDRAEEILRQYLSNAVHYAGGEKKITIRSETAPDSICISVFNTGCPIPEEELQDIWIEFYKQDKARTRNTEHAGMGLPIVKTIMETLGGECGVQNKEDGVEFWFTLKPAQVN